MGAKNLLLIRMGGLGDLLAVLPGVRYLRARFPGSRLTLVGREGYGRLFLETGVVDELEPESRPRFARLFSDGGDLPEDSSSWLDRFDEVWGWFQTRQPAGLTETLARLGKSRRMIVYDVRSNMTAGRYFFRETVRGLAPAVLPGGAFEGFHALPVTETMVRGGRRLAENKGLGPGLGFVVIHPGSGGVRKRWPLDRFVETAVHLSDGGRPGLLVTGEADADLAARLDETAFPRHWAHVSNPDILDLAGLLSCSSLYLGNDSGVTHLAAACGAPVLAVFGAETSRVWKPEGRSRVLVGSEAASVRVSDVTAAARSLLTGD